MIEFTGEETAADILKAVLDDFSFHESFPNIPANARTAYDPNGIPILRYEARVRDNLGEFLCFYRLDKMTENVFAECASIYDEAAAQGLIEEDALERAKSIRHLAFYAIRAMILRLMLLQMALFEESFSETMCIAAGALFAVFADAFQEAGAVETANKVRQSAREILDKTIDTAAKKRRDMLVEVLNVLPSIQIPTRAGRPQGSVKPEKVKAQEAAEFEKEIEEAIRSLFKTKGKMPTKTAVAEALGMGGKSPQGSDTRLNSFNNKLSRLKVNYAAIVQRLDLHE